MLAKRGVIYISTGEKNYTEALISVRSLKKFNPELSVTIYTDEREADPVFDNFVIIEQPQYSAQDKALHICRTPYEETLYIDSDTYVTGGLSEYFEVLDYCDFAGTIETARFTHSVVGGKRSCPISNANAQTRSSYRCGGPTGIESANSAGVAGGC